MAGRGRIVLNPQHRGRCPGLPAGADPKGIYAAPWNCCKRVREGWPRALYKIRVMVGWAKAKQRCWTCSGDLTSTGRTSSRSRQYLSTSPKHLADAAVYKPGSSSRPSGLHGENEAELLQVAVALTRSSYHAG